MPAPLERKNFLICSLHRRFKYRSPNWHGRATLLQVQKPLGLKPTGVTRPALGSKNTCEVELLAGARRVIHRREGGALVDDGLHVFEHVNIGHGIALHSKEVAFFSDGDSAEIVES